jgi:hemolysin activation/secretion protein
MNLKLANLFGSGKNFELTYRGYLNNSQDLQMKFLWPYFLKTKLALDFSFKLAKFDSTWIEIANDIGLQYRLGGNNYLKFYFQNQTINSFVVDSQFVKINKRLPAVHDVVNNLYGLAIRKSTLDYFNNPRKGFLLNLEVGAGTKRIVPMEGLQQLKLSGSNAEVYNLYDSIQLLTMQYKLQGNFSYYLNFRKNWVLHSQINTAMLMNQNLFFNELFRIGGLKTLKGFDEQSIFANKYLIGNFELRYLFQQNSGFMIFWNGAWYENTALPQVRVDKPWGVGVGMNIETGAGVFSLYYALGKQLGNEFEFQRAKIHFGFVNFF